MRHRHRPEPLEPGKFDGDGKLALVGGWTPSSDFGGPTLKEAATTGSARYLEIGATNGSSIGAWRATRWLEQGKYRVEGKLKTRGLNADPGDTRGGAGIRVSKGRPENYRTGDSEWVLFQQPFQVEEPLAEVSFVCEFRGVAGQAQFDLETLKVVRLPASER